MHIRELLENDDDHADALAKTGFWGAQAAGCVFFARDTKRFLLAHRSREVEQPGTFGSWGGAIDANESPLAAVKREVHEEAGYSGAVQIRPMYVFTKGTFRYSNFLAIVPHEFKPVLNWESDGFRWCKYGAWPKPLHFGILSLISDPASAALMQKMATA